MPMSVSERLAQEDAILREIRATLSSYQSMGLAAPRRKGAVYASSPITSGWRLYRNQANSARFQELVMQPNLRDGALFGEHLRSRGWPLVIVPGEFFAKGWAQEHYMSLWRQVIVRFARSVAFNIRWQWSTGCVEEFLIAIQGQKRVLNCDGQPLDLRHGADLVRQAIDVIEHWGHNAQPLYDLWRQIDLTIDAIHPKRKTS